LNKAVRDCALCRLLMSQDVRVGPEVIQDPAVHITRYDTFLLEKSISYRKFEDFVTWVDTSKIKRQILKYNDRLDDFDIM
jgi:U3 small nucleolar ribonucleoprotein protein IMP3